MRFTGTIRVAAPSDASQIQRIYARMVTGTAISFELEPPTAPEMAKRIEATLATYPYLVAEHPGQVLGYAYASQHRAREAYQGFHAAYAGIALPNAAGDPAARHATQTPTGLAPTL
jgi:L-amino acid N-acyltransferase YncA